MNADQLSLYITAEHNCGYYDDRNSANLVPDPQVSMNNGLYSLLVSHGFRRSGDFVYRPHCKTCSACMPCRIDIAQFRANRNQRRCLKNNADLTMHIKDARFSDEYLALYQRYLNRRHSDSSMANPQADDFTKFLLNDWGKTLFIESRLEGKLACIAVVDYLNNGLSAVYSFFDPDLGHRSLGTFAILQQVWLARLYRLPHVYLGYWIQQHPKMDYKKHFQPLEYLQHDHWQTFNNAS
ncbi:MAG: arginyltransferase [Gammaproteobacteria bacterium]|nr:arginyltransferase [Gammaproteobacteria bacterium]